MGLCIKKSKKGAFTIIELLTVMSIIVILIGLLVPASNKVRRFAMDVRQKAQFHSIEAALELFYSEHEMYPPSGALDESPVPGYTDDLFEYCGAMKLAEAMMGQDLMGYHPDSLFRSDGIGGTSGGKDLYDSNDAWDALQWNGNLKSRRGPYLPLENANAYRLEELYKQTDPYRSDRFVLGDVYNRVSNLKTGRRVGMPILYYKADTSKNAHDRLDPDNPNNIYDYLDNYDLVLLGFPGQAMPPAGPSHELEDARRFYANTRNDKVSIDRPYKADTYILISAGFDGEYGTADDICNFDWKYMELP